jgi:hypothetical protein
LQVWANDEAQRENRTQESNNVVKPFPILVNFDQIYLKGNKFSVSGYVPDDTKTCFLRYFLYLGCKALDQKLTIYNQIPKRRCEGKRGREVLNIVGRTDIICLNSYIYI